jgi:hypothetical protein
VTSRDALGFAGAAALSVGVLYVVVRFGPSAVVAGVGDAVGPAARATGVDTTDTPYEGYGAAGVAGNVTNKISGGGFELVGRWIGQRVADLRGL